MHELGITQGIIDRARVAALANNAVRVTGLYLVITPAADFTEESISMYFAMLTAEDELLSGAELHFVRQPVDVACLECGALFPMDEAGQRCPGCSSRAVRVDPEAPMIQLRDVEIDDGQG